MKKIILFFLLFSTRVFSYEYDLAICAIFRDEARFLKEWIEFHKLVGVQHFYLYNNLSKDNYLSVLEPYIISGEVDLYEWPYEHENITQWNTIQCSAYMQTIAKQANVVKWVAMIDLDEFIVPIEHDDILTFLKEYDDYSSVGINWQMYGTSMINRIPEDQLMIENLMLKGPEVCSFTYHVKCIIRPDRVTICNNPHYCFFHIGHQVDVNKKYFPGAATNEINIDKIRINHYWCRDIEYLTNVKWPRHNSYACGSEFHVIWYIGCEFFNQLYDPCIEKYIPRLKENMSLVK